MPEIIGFDPDPDFREWDAADGTATGMYHYDDGTSARGRMPAEFAVALVKKPKAPAAPNPAEAVPKPAEPGSYEAFEQQQIEREKQGKSFSIEIPKASRIAYVHNNPGNLKYVGQEGAHQGWPAEDGGYWAAFETPEAGYAALQHQVKVDTERGLSLGQFVTKYAPPDSNDTAGYIASAARELGGSPDTPLASINPERLARFMAQKESSTVVGGVSPEPQTGSTLAAERYPASVGRLTMAGAEVTGAPLTPEQLEERQRATMDRTNLLASAAQMAADAKVQGRNEALAAVASNYQDQQRNAQRQLTEHQAIKAEAAQNIQQTMSTQLDPGRLFRQMSGGDVLLGLLSVTLSAVGQTFQQRAGTAAPNMALQRIVKAVDDDVEEQKQSKQSRLAYWTRVYGNAEQGISATRAEMLNASSQYLAAKAQTSVQNADIQAAALQQSQELMALGQKEAEKLQQIEEQKLSVKYAAPPPVSPQDPSKLLASIEAVKKARQELILSGASEQQADEVLRAQGLTPLAGETVEQHAARQTAEGRADVATSKELADIDAAQQTWAKALAALDKLEKHGLTNADLYKPGFPGAGIVGAVTPGLPGKAEVDEFNQAFQEGVNAQIRAEKGPQTEGDVARQQGEIAGSGNITSIRRGITSKLEALRRLRASVMGRREGSAERVIERQQPYTGRPVTGRVPEP